jgi:hypothetical protein
MAQVRSKVRSRVIFWVTVPVIAMVGAPVSVRLTVCVIDWDTAQVRSRIRSQVMSVVFISLGCWLGLMRLLRLWLGL